MSNSNSNSNASGNGEYHSIKISRKRYLDLMNKAMNALMKDLYNPVGKTHPGDRLTWQNINQMKKAIQKFRRPGNATGRVNYNNNREFQATNNKKITLQNYNINGTNKGGTISWNVEKRRPNGRRITYMTMAVNNNKPVNLHKLNVGFWNAAFVNNRGMIRPRNNAAMVLQRAWRAKKNKGPFSNPVIQGLLQQMPMPKASRSSLAAAFRKPTAFNKNARERSKRVDPYWRALLTNIKRQSILKGKVSLLSRGENKAIGYRGTQRIAFGPNGKWHIPANKRQNALTNIQALHRAHQNYLARSRAARAARRAAAK